MSNYEVRVQRWNRSTETRQFQTKKQADGFAARVSRSPFVAAIFIAKDGGTPVKVYEDKKRSE